MNRTQKAVDTVPDLTMPTVTTGQRPGAGQNGWLSIAEAADHLGLAAKTIRRWVRSGKLPAELQEGRFGEEYRIRETDLEALSSARRVLEVIQVKEPAAGAGLMALTAALRDRDAELVAQLAERDRERDQALEVFKGELAEEMRSQLEQLRVDLVDAGHVRRPPVFHRLRRMLGGDPQG
jgi:excisionase family DNA binding protein